MNAYLVLTICSVALAAATPFTPHPAPHFAPAPHRIGLPETDAKKIETATEIPVLDLNQFCELLQSTEQRTECLEYVKQNIKPVVGPQDQDKVRANFNHEKLFPLDLQVFVPSENSWYLQDSHNHKFLGKPLVNVDKRPEQNLEVSLTGEKRAHSTLIRL